MRGQSIAIGSGLAGFAAAITLQSKGHQVACVSSGPGATAVSSGAWSLGRIVGEATFEQHWSRPAVRQAFGQIMADRLLDIDAVTVSQAIDAIAMSLSPHLEVAMSWQCPLVLPTTFGEWRSVYGGQVIQNRSNLGSLRGKRVLLVGSPRWRYPFKEIAHRLNRSAPGGAVNITTGEIHFPDTGQDWPIPRLFALLETDRGKARLLEELKRIIEKDRPDFLLLPPLLSQSGYNTLSKAISVELGECVATIEPCAGYRLQRAIEQSLRDRNVEIIQSTRLNMKSSQATINSVEIFTPQGRRELPVDSVTLATGRLFGGGTVLGFDRLSEPLFDFPLFVDRARRRVHRRAELDWTPTRFTKDQPWAKPGVWVDSKWIPRDENAVRPLNNVRACGSIIGGIDWAHAGIGLGFAALSGRLCAEDG